MWAMSRWPAHLTTFARGQAQSSGRRREPATTYDYTDAEGNVLTLRGELSARTIAKLGEPPARAATSPRTPGTGAPRCCSSASRFAG